MPKKPSSMRLKTFALFAVLVYLLLWVTVLPPMDQLKSVFGEGTEEPVIELDDEFEITATDLEGGTLDELQQPVRLDGGEFEPDRKRPTRPRDGQAEKPGDKSAEDGSRRPNAGPQAPPVELTPQQVRVRLKQVAESTASATFELTTVDENGTPVSRGKVRILAASGREMDGELLRLWAQREKARPAEAFIGGDEGSDTNRDGKLATRIPTGMALEVLALDRSGKLGARLELPPSTMGESVKHELVLKEDHDVPPLGAALTAAAEGAEGGASGATGGAGADGAATEGELGLALVHLELKTQDGEPIAKATVRLDPTAQAEEAGAAIETWLAHEQAGRGAERLTSEEGTRAKDGAVDLLLPAGVPLRLDAAENTRRTATLELGPLEAGTRAVETLALLTEAEHTLLARAEEQEARKQGRDGEPESKDEQRARTLGWLDVEVVCERTGEPLQKARLFLVPYVAKGEGAEEVRGAEQSQEQLQAGVLAWVEQELPDSPELAALGEAGARMGAGGRLSLGMMPRVPYLLRCVLRGRTPTAAVVPALSPGEHHVLHLTLRDDSTPRFGGEIVVDTDGGILPATVIVVDDEPLARADSEGRFVLYFEEGAPTTARLEHPLCETLELTLPTEEQRFVMKLKPDVDPALLERARAAQKQADEVAARRAKRAERLANREEGAAAVEGEGAAGGEPAGGEAPRKSGDRTAGSDRQAPANREGRPRPERGEPAVTEDAVLRALGVKKDG